MTQSEIERTKTDQLSQYWQPVTPRQIEYGRNLLIELVSDLPEKPALLLGGVDSTTLLFALYAAGKRPDCYTFYIEGFENPDVRAGKQTCDTIGVPHYHIALPKEETKVWQLVQETLMAVDWGIVPKIKKTIIQTVYPALVMARTLQERYTHVVTGLNAEPCLATTRRDSVLLHDIGEMKFRLMRIPTGFSDPTGTIYHIRDVYQAHGLTLFDPYADKRFVAWITQFPIKTCHTPFQKAILVRLFEQEWRRSKTYRVSSPYQIGTGIREQQDLFLTDTTYNPLGYKSIIGVYNQLARQLGIDTTIGTRYWEAPNYPEDTIEPWPGPIDLRVWIEPRNTPRYLACDGNGEWLDRDGNYTGAPDEHDYQVLADAIGYQYRPWPIKIQDIIQEVANQTEGD